MNYDLDFLSSIFIENWYCGRISAYSAFGNECAFNKKSDMDIVRRAAREHGYIAHFSHGILRRLEKINN